MEPSKRVTLSLANKEDAEQLAQISRRAFHSDVDVGAPGEEGGPPGYDSPEFQTNLMRWCDYYKILYDGQIVGGLIVARKGSGHYECARIFVDPEYHNRGIATRAFELAWQMYPDAEIWTLGTPEWNVRTKHFYEKLGFVQVGWTKEEPEWRGRFYEKLMDPNQPHVGTGISELTPGMKQVQVEAEVLEISEPREVHSRTGEPLKVAEATVQDETGSTKLALWNDQIRQVKVNNKIRIYNGYVTSFRGQKQLNVGRYDPLVILS